MAKPTTAAVLQLNIVRLKNFLNFTKAFLKKKNPVKMFITQSVTYIKNLVTVKEKIRNIERRITFEKYKLKKTELILAQNSEHLFLKGRSINQTR